AREKVIEKARKYIHFCTYATDEVVLREGDYGDSAFFIVNGSVEVVLAPAVGEQSKPRVRGGAHVPPAKRAGARPGATPMLGRAGTSSAVILSAFPAEILPGGKAVLEAGEIFGELSALSRYPISATVRAVGPLRLLQIRLPGLRMLSAASKEFKKFLDTRYRERTLA